MTAPDPAKRKALQKIAIGQIQMSWTIEENCNAIERSMHLAHARGAAICVFPELAITGFTGKSSISRPQSWSVLQSLASPRCAGP
jgi:predicted amidohydrolase